MIAANRYNLIMMNNNQAATNAIVGSSGGSGGIMPKLKAVPAGGGGHKRTDGQHNKVFEMSSKEHHDQYARVGIQAKVMSSS